jgi:hypothetical protein
MATDLPDGLIPRNTIRGRPRTSGSVRCARCGRNAGKARASWAEGKICGPCFTVATRTHGTRPGCGNHCALRDDLTALLLTNPADPTTATRLVNVLCQADQPESIIAWKRSPKVQALLTAVSSGQTPLTHEGLDNHRETAGRAAEHPSRHRHWSPTHSATATRSRSSTPTPPVNRGRDTSTGGLNLNEQGSPSAVH